MSFYRTYRPITIDEIDNATVRDALMRLLTKPKNSLPHAFLFTGPRGGGKTTAARIVAKIFNCEKPAKSGPCGKCDQCVSIAEGKNLDVLELDAASNRGIDEIRTLRDGIALSPVSAPYKVYIIDEVHMLTTEAFNALLKTLEEPPAHAVFVLATTDPHKVPVTIQSRCIILPFAKATVGELVTALTRIIKSEKLTISDDAVEMIAQTADGSFRDAVKNLEQMSFTGGKISSDSVRAVLAVSDTGVRQQFLEHLSKREIKSVLEIIKTVTETGKDVRLFTSEILSDMELLLLARTLQDNETGWTAEDLCDAIKKISGAYVQMKQTAITQLPLEVAVIEFCMQADKSSHQTTVQEETKTVKQEHHKTEIPVQNKAIGMLTYEHLVDHWSDVIAELKPYNHSVAGVMRSTRPKAVGDGIVTIEAFYTFHKDKLSETKTRDIIATVLKKLFGEYVKVEVVLGKK